MATKIQSKSYPPGYSLMGNLSEDPNKMWPIYYLERKANEHLYDNHVQRPVNEHSAHDKEMLKRTMLEHEAIFQKQVYELHRLYGVQKDMMDEFQTRGLHRSSVPAETYQSNSFSSQMQSEYSQMIQQSSHFAMVKNCVKNVPFGGTHGMKAPLEFIKDGGIQSGLVAGKNSSSFQKNISADYEFQSNSRRMRDLHLPADSYIDLEDEDISERKDVPQSSAYRAEIPSGNSNSDSIMKLSLGIVESNSSRQAECLFGLKARNSIPAENAIALNKHISKTCAAQPLESTSFEFLGMRTHSERNLGHHMAMRSNIKPDDGLTNKYSVADFRCLDGETSGQFPFFTNSESGRSGKDLYLSSQSLYDQRYSLASGQLQSNHNKIHESYSPDSSKLEMWFKQKHVNGIETCARSSRAKISNNSSSVFPFIPASFAGSQKSFRSSSLLVSSGTNPLNGISYRPTSTKEIPCLNVLSNTVAKSVNTTRATQNAVATSEIQQNDGDMISGQGANSDNPYHSTESFHRFHLNVSSAHQAFLPYKLNHMDNANSSVNGNVDYQSNSAKDVKCKSLEALKDINLNQALPCATDDSPSEQVDLLTHNVERRNKDVPGVPSWLRKAECSMQSVNLNLLASDTEVTFSDDHSQLPNTTTSAEIGTIEEDKTKFSVHDSPTSLQVKDHTVKTNEASDHTNKRPNSFAVPELPENISLACPSALELEHSSNNNLNRKGKDELLLDGLNDDQKILRSKKKADDKGLHAERSVDIYGTNYRSLINLNVEFSCSDEEVLSDSMVANKLPSSYRTSGTKTSSKIDLEVAVCHDEHTILSEREAIMSDESLISEEKKCSVDTLASVAAENIVAISMHQSSHEAEVTCHHASPPPVLLHWFAEVALSNNKGTKMPNKGRDVSISLDVLDLFEAMTLELEEVEVHDLCNNINEPVNKENTDEEDIGVASQLFTRRRLGQSRRCRQQRKDFQKDVLPGLALLSRHEVTEDLQLIEGLMRASGSSWQSGLGRRNSGRKGTNSRSKGRRRRINCADTSTEVHASPPSPAPAPSRPNNNDPEVVGSSIIGWGRTTRRCRRQKSLPGNIVSSLT